MAHGSTIRDRLVLILAALWRGETEGTFSGERFFLFRARRDEIPEGGLGVVATLEVGSDDDKIFTLEVDVEELG